MKSKQLFMVLLCVLCSLLIACSADNAKLADTSQPGGHLTDDHNAHTSSVMAAKEEGSQKAPEMTLDDLEHATIGIVVGTIYDAAVQERFPNAERMYFNSSADALLALEQGRVDAFFTDKPVYVGMCWENNPVTAIDAPFETIYNALILEKENYDKTLLEQINTFIAQAEKDGTLDALAEKWFDRTEPTEHPDYTTLTGENGTLRVSIGDSTRPFAYQKGDGYSGYEVDFLTRFAQAYGYKLDLQGMAFSALIPSISTGKCDIGACGITVTPERAESVTFADPHFKTHGVAVILKDATGSTGNTPADQEDPSAAGGFWDELKEDFHKTFIRDERWKLIVEGVGVTILISICSAVAGTLLGFGLYMLSLSDMKLLTLLSKGIAKVYSRIVEGTPAVVILMILFYVVFGNSRDISGVMVAIMCFALTFGAFVYDHLTLSVSSVDLGQTEAAYALGYNKNKAFFRIIFPQAMTIFLPSYCGHAVELIKATAVVGYVAVNDLTKVGDIIRSNTYEAFFPLFATASIYFLLTWGLSLLLELVKMYFEPKRRSAEVVLKGVKTE